MSTTMISESNALAATPPRRIHWYSIGPTNNETMDKSNTFQSQICRKTATLTDKRQNYTRWIFGEYKLDCLRVPQIAKLTETNHQLIME